ncbi:MAG: hypothetical protein ACPF9D_01385 [Owenweeksia sp.]
MACACDKSERAQDFVDPVPVIDSIPDVNDSVHNPVDTVIDVNDTIPQTAYVTYFTKAGDHYSDREAIDLLSKDSILIKAVFDSSAVYETVQPSNQKDWNKLIGFSDCGTHHHTNSMRTVWRYDKNKGIEIGAYWYKSGKRHWKNLKTIQPFDTVEVAVVARASKYIVRVDEITFEEPRACNSSVFRYWLFPYFGGDETAPHDITIQVQHVFPIKE